MSQSNEKRKEIIKELCENFKKSNDKNMEYLQALSHLLEGILK